MHTSRGLVPICALFFALIGAGAAHAQERDLWYVLSQGEQAINSAHVQVTSLDDGTFRYVWESRTPVTLRVIWTTATMVATAQPSEASHRRWLVEYEDSAYNMTVEVGVDGFETERYYENIDLRMRRCSKEEAEDIEPVDQTGAQVLSFPVSVRAHR